MNDESFISSNLSRIKFKNVFSEELKSGLRIGLDFGRWLLKVV